VLGKEVNQYKVACTNYLAMDNTKPPFDNKKVREAFTYALNRDLREKVVDRDINKKALSWLPEGVPGYDPNLGKEYDFNADKARKALADAGYPDGKGLPEVVYNYAATSEGQRTADWYLEQFQQVLNVHLKLNPMELAAYSASFDDPKNHLPGMFEYGWCADYLHPSDWLYLVFGSGQGNNVVGYNSAEFDKISKAADAELDPAKAMDLYKQAHALLLSDFPVIFFDTPTATRLVKPRVQGLKPNSLDGGVIGGFFWEDIDVAA
jgi:oligopeptide transport system substrate-binding protein